MRNKSRIFKLHINMNSIQLTIDSLSHKLNNQTILDNINLELIGFQSVTLLGPNGAGKSTLIKSIAANLYCQSGLINLNGLNSELHRNEYLKLIGYMPEAPLVINELSVIEQLQLMAHCKQVEVAKNSIDRVIEICQLQKVLSKRTKNLSLGFKQRLNLAQAILNKPKMLVMDEPLNGLDPHLIIKFRNIINELKASTLIIVSTHYLAEAQNISDRILIMQDGQLLDNINMNKTLQKIDIEEVYMQHTSLNEGVL